MEPLPWCQNVFNITLCSLKQSYTKGQAIWQIKREREREREGVVTNTYLIKRERKSIMGSPRMRWFRDVEKKMFRI